MREYRVLGQVSSLHLHPDRGGESLRSVAAIEVVAGMGIKGNDRYFGRTSRSTGQPTIRQVSLMEREQISEHAKTLGLTEIAPGAVRANIETTGVSLVALVGKHVQIGEAVLLLCEARQPCAKMDAVCNGLRALMEQNRQGVLARIIRSGRIAAGDLIFRGQLDPDHDKLAPSKA